MDKFDVIYCINLDERTDRNELLLAELIKIGVDMTKVVRISAIKHEIPNLGCSKSHYLCLQAFEKSNHDNCLILEDDFTFKETKNITNFMLTRFWDSNISWDVLMLSAFERQVSPSTVPWLVKAIEVQTASGYAITRQFLPILKQNLEESISKTEAAGKAICELWNDQNWKKLQPHHKWYVMRPKLGFQRDNYSNIEQRHVSYLDKFDIKLNYPFKYVLGVMTCKQNLPNAELQYHKHLSDMKQYPIIYVKFLGDPNLETEWSYNEKENLLTLKCEDDYLNLPNKVYMFLKAIRQLFPNMNGVFKTDDDIKINLPKLYDLLEQNKNVPYWGKCVNGNAYLSLYLSSKEHVITQYPEFKNIPVRVEQGAYCSGGGYYINYNTVRLILDNPNYFSPFPKNTYMDNIVHNQQLTYFNNLNVFEDKTIGVVLTRNNVQPKDMIHELKEALCWDGI